MKASTVCWPAVIKYDRDAELAFVADQSEWENDVELHRFAHRDGDLLIDSEGKLFSLSVHADRMTLELKPERVSLDDMIALIRAHAVQDGACCVSKFSAGSIAEAVQWFKGA